MTLVTSTPKLLIKYPRSDDFSVDIKCISVMDWYYDFISPFAYLQSTRLEEFTARESVVCKPVLFAGLLDHWSNVGPAEIPPKRRWTFEHVVWVAHRDKIAFKLPEYHPFNPLPLLRLSIALENRVDVVQRLFRFVWVEGNVPQNESAFDALLVEFDLTVCDINTDAVKEQLRDNGLEAIEQGIFGVPTISRNNQLFWGYDATDMAKAHREFIAGATGGWPADNISAVKQFKEGPGRQRR